MPDTVKRVNVRIAGVAYQLAATEDETHIRKMAAQADEMIRQVLLASPHLSQSMATILALVNAMDEVNKFRRQSESYKRKRIPWPSSRSNSKPSSTASGAKLGHAQGPTAHAAFDCRIRKTL